jgi:hypothetical protein
MSIYTVIPAKRPIGRVGPVLPQPMSEPLPGETTTPALRADPPHKGGNNRNEAVRSPSSPAACK